LIFPLFLSYYLPILLIFYILFVLFRLFLHFYQFITKYFSKILKTSIDFYKYCDKIKSSKEKKRKLQKTGGRSNEIIDLTN